MKKYIIFMLLSVCNLSAKSQCEKPYIPFSVFQQIPGLMNDTIVYLETNFDDRRECFVGKTIDEVLNTLEMPVIAFSSSFLTDGSVSGIELALTDYDYEKNPTRLNHLFFQGLYIAFEDRIETKALRNLLNEYPETKWVAEHYEFFKDFKVKSVGNNYMKKIPIQNRYARDLFTTLEILRAPSDCNWSHVVQEGLPQIRQIFKDALGAPQEDNIFYRMDMPTERIDADDVEIIPVEYFTVDSTDLRYAPSVTQSLKPQTGRVSYYIVNQYVDFYLEIAAEYDGNGFQVVEYNKIDNAVGERIAKLGDNPVYIVDLKVNPSLGVTNRYVVYTINGNYRYFLPDGTEGYLIDEIKAIKRKYRKK